MQLIRKSLIFDFSVEFHRKFPGWKANPVFADSIMAQFKEFLSEKKFTYECEWNRDLEELRDYIARKKYNGKINGLITELESELKQEIKKEFDLHSEQIAEFLYLDMIEKYFDRRERDRHSLLKDKQALEAVRVLKNPKEYRNILALN